MTKTVVGLYDDFSTADHVVRALEDSGFDRNDISLIAQDATHGNQPPMSAEASSHADGVSDGVATGAGTGAVLGGIAGLLVGLGALAIPGFGPLLAAGPLATVLAGAGAGAVAGGLIGALVDAGVPEEQAQSYAEGVRRGGTLVTVRAPEGRAGEAAEILNHFGPVDMPERAAEWRAASHAEDAAGAASSTDMRARDATAYSRDLGEHLSGRQDWSTHDRDVAGSGTPALSEAELGGRQGDGSPRPHQDQATSVAPGQASEMSDLPASGTQSGDAGPLAANTRGGMAGDQGAGGLRTDEQPRIQNQDMAAGGTPGAGPEDMHEPGMDRQSGQNQGRIEVERGFAGIGHGQWETRDLQEIVSEDAPQDIQHGQGMAHDTGMGQPASRMESGMDRGAQMDDGQHLNMADSSQGTDMKSGPGFDQSGPKGQDWQNQGLSSGLPDEQALGTDSSGSSGINNQDWRSRELGAGGPGSAGGEGAWQSGSSQPASPSGTPPAVTSGSDYQTRAYQSFDGDFRRHHEMVFGASGRAYGEWEPGYRYGYELARNPQYRGRKWSEIEPAARREWESNHPGYAWDEYRAAIRHSWERVSASMGEQEPGLGDQTGFQPGSQQDHGRPAGLEGDWDRR